MLRYAREQSPSGLAWLAADAEALPLRSASQDLLFSSLALQWCPQLPLALNEAFRVLKPGGCMAFNTLVAGTLVELREAWQAVDGFVHVNRFMPLPQLQGILAGAGFASWHCEVEMHVLHYAQLSELTHELKALGAAKATVLALRLKKRRDDYRGRPHVVPSLSTVKSAIGQTKRRVR